MKKDLRYYWRENFRKSFFEELTRLFLIFGCDFDILILTLTLKIAATTVKLSHLQISVKLEINIKLSEIHLTV